MCDSIPVQLTRKIPNVPIKKKKKKQVLRTVRRCILTQCVPDMQPSFPGWEELNWMQLFYRNAFGICTFVDQ